MVHQYKQNGYNIVLDACSGAVHAVDEVAYDMISLYPDHTEEEIIAAMTEKYGASAGADELAECLDDIRTLEKEGKLFTPDSHAGLAAERKRSGTVKALCLHVAHTCNLNCSYCFAGQGKYQGERAVMSLDVAKRAIDFLVESSGTRKNLEVDFFGGEPLMNWEVVKQTVAYARGLEALYNKNFRFTLTTNGLLVDDEVMEFCNREMNNVVMSLDGRREVHDRFRKNYAGQGSYDLVVPKFQKFAALRGDKSYYMRGTYTHYNTDFTNDLFHMASLGFKELSMEPVVCSPDDPCALTENDLPILFGQYEILANEMLKREREKEGRGFRFYHYMIDLEHGPCIYKRIAGCGSGTEYLAVTPQGELFPCHQFVGDPKYSMGNIRDGVTNEALVREFGNCNAYSRPECESCWAKLYCSGGCAANAYHATGSISGVYKYGCRLFRKRMECAIMMKVAESVEGLAYENEKSGHCADCESGNENTCM